MGRSDGAMKGAGRWLARNYAAALSVVTGLLLCAMYMVSGLGGDDWAYMAVFGRYDGFADYEGGVGKFLFTYPAQHWLGTNGRAANYLAAYIGAFLPVWAIHLLMGVCALGLCMLAVWAVGAWRRVGRQCAGALAALAVMFGLPWADEMFTYDVALNYMAASALALGFVWLVARERGASRWIVLCAGLVAGAMHEAAGVPVACGAALYFICHRRSWRALSRAQLWGWTAFALGALTTILSPGIWRRAAASVEVARQWSVWESLLFSAPLVVVLAGVLAVIGIGILCGRRGWRGALSDPLTSVFAVAALVAGLFCMAGDFVGRVGWCAQLYAMIALWRIGVSAVRIPRVSAGVLCALAAMAIVAHGALTIPVLAADGRLERDIARQAGRERSTLLYVDLPDVTAQPWYTVGKLRALRGTHPYYTECISRYYDLPPTVLIPKAFEGIDLDTLSRTVTDAGGRYRLSPEPLAPVTGRYRRTTVWSADVAADTAVIQFTTPSGRPMWLAMPHRYHFYLWAN